MADPYRPTLWYFTAANRAGLVFSAPAAAWIANTDATYLAWVGRGNTAKNFTTDGRLAQALAQELGRQLPGTTLSATLAHLMLAVAPTSWTGVAAADLVALVLAAGVAVTSSGDSALNATYETSGDRFTMMKRIADYIAAFAAFPNGASTLTWAARTGSVTFDTTAHFLAVWRGIADYLESWRAWFDAGATGSAPTFGSKAIA